MARAYDPVRVAPKDAPDVWARWYVNSRCHHRKECRVSNTVDGAGAPVSSGLLALAESFRVPQGLRDAVLDAAVPPPSAGQLWRAEDGSVAVLGLLISVRAGEDRLPDVLFCPVTLDVEDAFGVGGVVASSVLGDAEVQLWPGLARWVPLAVLDHLLDDGQDLLGAAARTEETARAAADDPASTTALLDMVDVFSGAAQALAQVADDMSALASSPRLTVATTSTGQNVGGVSLVEALPGSGADKIRVLTDVLGVSGADALAVLRSRRPLTNKEADQVRRHLGLGAQDVGHGGFPLALAAELEQPRWRRPLLQTAPAAGLAEARAAAAAGVFGLAARDSASEPNWAERIERYLQAGG